ncbi:hypothetical protein BGW36DRAFT_382972 [Talaromyces proteolyticus]|uniref:Uncharacterized protein n=1 Tax=Talaromyces proteolyticus TaxID=1131652 RepID=A0AAD4KMY7_9EURO|nr:uncharacterized protein BGW36DRAFT_382972 [Talaromyces proteolyticus]KAH8695580.1 hypothetical protein BGW36DRAFT_382972 [Talaromyces proteolyticus]
MDPSITKNGPPYPFTTAQLGGEPSTNVDVPICCVFLVLFVCGAVSHMTIFQVNRRRNHKFIPSAMTFGFCVARTLACALRISWAYNLDNVQLGIASGIFVAAGVLILFIINLLFAQRCLRAAHPSIGWNYVVRKIFLVLYALIVGVLVMVITATIYIHYTLDMHKLQQCRDVLLVGGTYMAFFSFLPLPIILLILLVPRHPSIPVEKFGTAGSWTSKLLIVLVTSLLLCLGASFRDGVNFLPSRLASNPYTVQNKACFYVFNFTIEIIVVYMFVLVRIDKRFWVPNGSEGTYLLSEETGAADLSLEKEIRNKTSGSSLA